MSSDKNCVTCPSYLTPDRASKFYETTINVPLCARYGKVLGVPGGSDKQNSIVGEKVASSCDSHGKKTPIKPPELPELRMFIPSSDAMMEDEPEPDDLRSVGSCRNCLFYIQPAEVSREHNVSAAACARRGQLIFPERVTKEAENCDSKLWAGRDSKIRNGYNASDLNLFPILMEAAEFDDSAAGRWKRERREGFVDPGDWPTDKPVSEDDRAVGIKSWRKIEDPNGSGHSVLIPVFDMDFFPEPEQRKIPQTGDKEAPEDYIDARDYVYSAFVEMLLLKETPALWGQPGVGKTELARHMAWLMQAPFDRVSITSSTEVEDLAGKMLLLGGETKFIEGRLPKRWQRPGVLLLDEPNAGQHDVWQFIRPLTDNSKQLVLDMSEHATVIDRHEHCFLLMAMNPTWDYRNTGVNELADADTNRLTHIYMELPDRSVEKQILVNAAKRDGWTPPKALVDKVMDVSDDVRAMCKDGSLPISWGVRNNLKVIRHLQFFNANTAYRRAVVDFLDPDLAQMVLKVVELKGL